MLCIDWCLRVNELSAGGHHMNRTNDNPDNEPLANDVVYVEIYKKYKITKRGVKRKKITK